MLGHVTVSAYSPAFDQPMALGLVIDGRDRHGETLHALSPVTGQRVAVVVADPVFVDADGERMHG
jgi:sarcosine oxidase subunit alpha